MKRKAVQLFASLALLAAHTARAATLTVTNTADNGPGSLRAALASAANGDTIDATGVSGTILLTSGQLMINRSVVITGPGPRNLAVDGRAASRVFLVSNNAVVTIASLAVTNGKVFGGTGGGIFNDGTLVLQSVSLSGNSARVGGGIANYRTLTVQNSTVSDNSATGPLPNQGGGGIFNEGTLTINQSTLAANFAESAGGAISSSGRLTISHSTVSANMIPIIRASGIDYRGSAFVLNHSIVAGNLGFGFDLSASGGFTGSFNFIGYDSLGNRGGDPQLAPLADNGGPTKTMALLPGSLCYNTGDPSFVSPPDFDQRGTGNPRVRFGRIDIGAYESETVVTESPVVTTEADEDDGTSDPAYGTGTSLHEAISYANKRPDNTSITFAPNVHTINLTRALPWLVTDMNIHGPGADHLTVRRDSGGEYPIFASDGLTTVSLSGMTITNGFGVLGGGIENLGRMTVSDCVIRGNSAYYGGGGIYNRSNPGWDELIVTNCIIRDNRSVSGGGILNGGALTVANSSITGNTADESFGGGALGGGIYNGATATISHCIINGNTAEESAEWPDEDTAGGGIFNDRTLNIEDSTIGNNSAAIGGGLGNGYEPLISFGGTVNINNCALTGNQARFGGAIYNAGIGNDPATVSAENSIVSDNIAESGGGIVNFGLLVLRNSTMARNRASGAGMSGGGLLNAVRSTNRISHCTISLNSCSGAGSYGGGIYGFGDLQISNSIVSLNSADHDPDISGIHTGNFNLIGGDPILGPLADNGGPTLTMALLPGSPCINAGDPSFVGPPHFDERGSGFLRVVHGRVDIGAFEVQVDGDSDGVLDTIDQCPNTPAGEIVNASGCSIAQLVPCAGPQSGGRWKNHGDYVSAVVEAAKEFVNAGLITRKEQAQLVAEAAQSRCGSKGGLR